MKYRILDNGVYRDMTPEEIKALQETDSEQPKMTKEQIMAELERLTQALEQIED